MSNPVLHFLIIIFVFFLQTSLAEAFCVKSTRANLRSQPKSNSKIQWVVGKYMPLVRVSKKGNWFKVADLDGERHWIYSSLLTKKYPCAAIKLERVNVRNGPGTSFPYSDYRIALKYESFRRVGQKGSWYQLANDLGTVGWVHKSALWLPIQKIRVKY
ncbi:MAG: hypothetical protein CL677_02180 [Bdellovibrionaceae bacterium]|nr:hypothetical protein [Pseudobdellovibrionaceae bacterium]|tara:strand:+ start:73639 stop:74112 length:474 start_codon:yes stop_codon:yes gene_type:complete